VRTIDEKCPIPVARKVVSGITADIAAVQMIAELKLPIRIQLIVDELQQPVKAACTHDAPYGPIALTSVQHSVRSVQPIGTITNILLMGSFARLFPFAHTSGQDCSCQ
jgi:hypothetical protein